MSLLWYTWAWDVKQKKQHWEIFKIRNFPTGTNSTLN